jgi:hypothetical protein
MCAVSGKLSVRTMQQYQLFFKELKYTAATSTTTTTTTTTIYNTKNDVELQMCSSKIGFFLF